MEWSQRKRDSREDNSGAEELGAEHRIADPGADRSGGRGADPTGAGPVEGSRRQEVVRGNSGGGRKGSKRMGWLPRGECAENPRRHGRVHTGEDCHWGLCVCVLRLFVHVIRARTLCIYEKKIRIFFKCIQEIRTAYDKWLILKNIFFFHLHTYWESNFQIKSIAFCFIFLLINMFN